MEKNGFHPACNRMNTVTCTFKSTFVFLFARYQPLICKNMRHSKRFMIPCSKNNNFCKMGGQNGFRRHIKYYGRSSRHHQIHASGYGLIPFRLFHHSSISGCCLLQYQSSEQNTAQVMPELHVLHNLLKLCGLRPLLVY